MWPVSHLPTWRGCSQTQGADQDVSVSLFGSSLVVHLYTHSLIWHEVLILMSVTQPFDGTGCSCRSPDVHHVAVGDPPAQPARLHHHWNMGCVSSSQ